MRSVTPRASVIIGEPHCVGAFRWPVARDHGHFQDGRCLVRLPVPEGAKQGSGGMDVNPMLKAQSVAMGRSSLPKVVVDGVSNSLQDWLEGRASRHDPVVPLGVLPSFRECRLPLILEESGDDGCNGAVDVVPWALFAGEEVKGFAPYSADLWVEVGVLLPYKEPLFDGVRGNTDGGVTMGAIGDQDGRGTTSASLLQSSGHGSAGAQLSKDAGRDACSTVPI